MARTEPSSAQREITAGRLLHWGDLHERRRRGFPVAWIARVGAGAGLAAWVARLADQGDIAASRVVVAATIAMFAWVMLGAPFRMYWRPDSPLLARLPIPGRALFDVAIIRSLRAAFGGLVVVAPAAAAIGVADSELALRHLSLVGAVALASALFIPAVALGAGALVAGGKADALFEAIGGTEVPTPPTAWLGLLPGLAAAAVVLGAIGAAGWVAGAPETEVGPAAPLLGGLVGGSVVAALMARQAAARVMPLAVREVAALDVQRLAHLEIHPPTAIERAVGARLAAGARLVHGKDARIMRRRFPMAFVTGALTTLSLWIIAGVQPSSAWLWALTITGGFAGYALLMATRLVAPPIEQRAILSLPIAPRDRARAKIAYLATWTLFYPLLGAVAIAARDLALAAAVLGVAVVATIAGSALVQRRSS
jgi:hypothetical protein